MKKIVVKSPVSARPAYPKNSLAAHLSIADDALVVRYFVVLPEDDLAPLGDLPSVDVGAHMRAVVKSESCVEGSAIGLEGSLATARVKEIGRHVFNPQIGSATVVGAGEQKDFSAFVLPMSSTGEVVEPYNHFAESANTKGTVNRTGRVKDAMAMFILYCDSAKAAVSNWTLIRPDADNLVVVDTTAGQWEVAQEGFNIFSLLPAVELRANGVPNGGTATIEVSVKRDGQVVPYDGELVVEQVAGYVPNTRVTVFNGTGSFKVMPLGLVSGEFARVKVGTKTLSGMADISIPVE